MTGAGSFSSGSSFWNRRAGSLFWSSSMRLSQPPQVLVLVVGHDRQGLGWARASTAAAAAFLTGSAGSLSFAGPAFSAGAFSAPGSSAAALLGDGLLDGRHHRGERRVIDRPRLAHRLRHRLGRRWPWPPRRSGPSVAPSGPPPAHRWACTGAAPAWRPTSACTTPVSSGFSSSKYDPREDGVDGRLALVHGQARLRQLDHQERDQTNRPARMPSCMSVRGDRSRSRQGTRSSVAPAQDLLRLSAMSIP